MKAIVAVDEKWGIGKDGDLLVHIPGDLKYFKNMTMGKTLIVGRKTLESFPGGKPLPGRKTIVLTENQNYSSSECVICRDINNVQSVALACISEESDLGEDVFVAGGGSIYKKLMPLCDTLFITKIEGDFNADVHFPNIDENPDFYLVWESEPHEEKGIRYKFTKYERTNKRGTENRNSK